MKKGVIAAFLLALGLSSLASLSAAPPGQATQGRAYREGGKIKYEPKVYNPRPYYYGGDLIYEQEGKSYRDSSGKIRRETEYSRHPYQYPNVRYDLERERLRAQDRARDEARQPQRNYEAGR